jgi:hypothetical protein
MLLIFITLLLLSTVFLLFCEISFCSVASEAPTFTSCSDLIVRIPLTSAAGVSVIPTPRGTTLSITNIDISSYHGGSLRIICQKNKKNNRFIIKKFLREEYKYKLFNLSTYKKIQKQLKMRKLRFLKKIVQLKLNNQIIFGIGAAAKANTLINYLKLDKDLVDGITDISPLKINKYTPLSRIPIYNDNYLKKFKKNIYVLILSWNISKLLISKIKKINKKIKFIKF